MLIERTIGSCLNHAINSASGSGSILTISDWFVGSSFLLFRHILHQVTLDKNFETSDECRRSVITNAGPKVTSRMSKIRFIDPPVHITQKSDLAEMYDFNTRLFDLKDVTSKVLLPAFRKDLDSRGEQSSTPRAVLLIDSLGPLLAHNSLPTLITWIGDLVRDSFIRALIQTIHVDSMPKSFTANSINEDKSERVTYAHPLPHRTLESLLSCSRSFIQCTPIPPHKLKPVPGPSMSKSATAFAAAAKILEENALSAPDSKSKDGRGAGSSDMLQPLFGALVLHRKSGTPKLACGRELVCVPINPNTEAESKLYGVEWKVAPSAPITATSSGASKAYAGTPLYNMAESPQQQRGADGRSVTSSGTPSNEHLKAKSSAESESENALAKLSAGLSFNVQLTAKQRAQRAAVELPFMHQGQPETEQYSDNQSLPEAIASGFAEFAADGFGLDVGQVGIPIETAGEGEIEEEEDFEDDEDF